MKVKDLVRMLERCPQNDLLLATDSRLGGTASVDDVIVGGRTAEGFTVIQLFADEWVNRIDELKCQRDKAENEASKNREETTRLVSTRLSPVIECEKCRMRYKALQKNDLRYCSWCGRKIEGDTHDDD